MTIPPVWSTIVTATATSTISSIWRTSAVRELGLLCACYYVSSIDWRLKNEKLLYLFKKSLLIAIQNSYKNTIKYSLQFPYIFIFFGGELLFL